MKNIRKLGYFCFKTADRFKPGIPDIYVRGGNWIECKVVKLGGQNRQINLYDKLSPEQKTFCGNLVEAGDSVLIIMRLEFPDENRLLVSTFTQVKYSKIYSNKELRFCDLIEKESDYPLSKLKIGFMGAR